MWLHFYWVPDHKGISGREAVAKKEAEAEKECLTGKQDQQDHVQWQRVEAHIEHILDN